MTAWENLDEILTVDGIDFFAGGMEDLAQSMGLPGQHTHPEVIETAAKIKEKVKAAGKYFADDVMESGHVVSVVKEGVAEMLQRNGRESQLGW